MKSGGWSLLSMPQETPTSWDKLLSQLIEASVIVALLELQSLTSSSPLILSSWSSAENGSALLLGGGKAYKMSLNSSTSPSLGSGPSRTLSPMNLRDLKKSMNLSIFWEEENVWELSSKFLPLLLLLQITKWKLPLQSRLLEGFIKWWPIGVKNFREKWLFRSFYLTMKSKIKGENPIPLCTSSEDWPALMKMFH